MDDIMHTYAERGEELYHHGVKGQKWGVRRYQNKDGSLTPAGKKRQNKNSGVNAIDRVKKALEKHKQATAAKKQKKAEEEQKKQKSKEEILKNGTAAEVLSLKGKISNNELQSAVTRLNLERQLSDMNNRDLNSGKDKLSETMDKVDKLNQNTKKGIDAYNTFAKIMNSLTDNDLPVIDGVNKSEQKAEKAKKRAEEEERKKIDKLVKTGSLEDIKANMHKLTAKDANEISKRFDFEKKVDEILRGERDTFGGNGKNKNNKDDEDDDD